MINSDEDLGGDVHTPTNDDDDDQYKRAPPYPVVIRKI
jgi:hypothetical protein